MRWSLFAVSALREDCVLRSSHWPCTTSPRKRAKEVVKIVARAKTTLKEARVQDTTTGRSQRQAHTSLTASRRSTKAHCGIPNRTATHEFVTGSRGSNGQIPQSVAENTYALPALVWGFLTTTVCVSKQSAERPLLLNSVMLVQLPLLLQ